MMKNVSGAQFKVNVDNIRHLEEENAPFLIHGLVSY